MPQDDEEVYESVMEDWEMEEMASEMECERMFERLRSEIEAELALYHLPVSKTIH